MPRRAARITYDEVRRLVSGVQAAGLPIDRVIFDGEKVEVVVRFASFDNAHTQRPREAEALIREPKL